MTENATFEVGRRIEIDQYKHVLVIELRCPMCVAEGKTDLVPTPSSRAWRPNFSQLEEMAKKLPALNALFEETERGKRAGLVCGRHGLQLRKAGIRTDMFHMVLERARERRQKSELSTIATMLGGEKVGEIQAAVVKAETRRTKAAVKKAGKGKDEGSGHKAQPYSRSKAHREAQDQLD